ncbi:MAG: DUF1611 domain-containing protein [Synechococcaceae cyanobacterium ELA739]
MLSATAPVVLLQHHGLDNLSGKTGLTLLRYRRAPILAVIDPDHAGQSLRQVTGIDRAVPIVASLAEALPLLPPDSSPVVAVVGLAPAGGRLPAGLRADLEAALAAGLCVANGLHTRLADDQLLAALVQPGRWIWDLRQEPEDLPVASAQAASLPGQRWLAMGSDMSVGKMSACLELQAAALERGLDARFVGTGQAGILISGQGVALDAVRVDYAAGAVERAVLEASSGAEPGTLVLVEGQGSFCHPGSTASLPLLRGSQPTALVLVHRAGQETIRNHPQIPLPPLAELIATLEAMAALARPHAAASGDPPRVGAIALNTGHLGAAEAAAAIADTEALTGLPCHDPVRAGGRGLLDALLGLNP